VAVAALRIARTQAIQNSRFSLVEIGQAQDVFGAGRRFSGERFFAIVSGPPRPPNDDAIFRGSGRLARDSGVGGSHGGTVHFDGLPTVRQSENADA